MSDSIIVWLRRDLRLYDNPALYAACSEAQRVIPVYVYAPEEELPWPPGAASRWWLHHSLHALETSLSSIGSRLVVIRGDTLSVLMMLREQTGAAAVYWNRLYDPVTIARDTRVKSALESIGVRTRSFPGYLVREPWEVKTGDDSPYKVYTPYSRASLQLGDPPAPVDEARPGPSGNDDPQGDGIDALQLLPTIRWDAGFYEYWRAGESAAWRRVATFIDSIAASYDRTRDQPAVDGTSRLSAHLHFGEISPRALWHAVVNGLGEHGVADSAYPYLRQLLWRDFAHQLLFHFPRITEENFKPAFDGFPWKEESSVLGAWRRSRTGIPLVDAGMRELWHTGFMHNRVRMNVASFLTKNAGVHWRVGARWFWDTLVDANLANNTMGWQWVAGSGPDAAPYFRIFNPVTQGQRFDPEGDYVRRWVPALAGLPAKYIHSPWTAPAGVLDDAGIRLGGDYPEPVLDLKATRGDALRAYSEYVKSR